MKQPIMSNDDTLIIGIVGGVVAFIAILIIIICIVRLRMTSAEYHNGPVMGLPPMQMGPGSVQVSYKGAPATALYAVPPYAAQNYATLPHKALHHSQQNLTQRQPTYSTMGRMTYFGNGQQQQAQQQQQQQQQQNGHHQPYIIYPDEKAYR